MKARRRKEADLSEELRGYVEELTERKMAGGVDATEARRQALAEVGGVEPVKELVREQWRGYAIETYVWRPLRMAVRRLWRDRSFTAIAVVTLALAIGANTAIFSVADHVLFRAMPYEDPEQIHILQMLSRKGVKFTQVPMQHVDALNAQRRGFSKVAFANGDDPIVMTVNGFTEAIPVVAVSPDYFHVLSVRAYRGRLFATSDAAEPGRNVVMTHAGWMKRLGGDPGAIGRTVRLGPTSFNLIGVLPPEFVFPSLFVKDVEVVRVEPPPPPGFTGGLFHPIVRRNPGVTKEQAQAEIESIIAGLGADDRSKGQSYPTLNDVQAVLYPLGRSVMKLLMAAAMLVLLIGCANLALMLVVRGQKGLRETGIRAALGASRMQLAMPAMFEALFLGVTAAVLALGITAAAFGTLLAQVPESVYGEAPVGVDTRVVWITLALGMGSGLLFAAWPAWRSARLDVQALILGREQRVVRRGRLGNWLIAAQVALSLVLVCGAVSASRAFIAVLNQPLGFEPKNVIHVNFMEKTKALQAAQRLARLPAVVAVGASHQVPLAGNGAYTGMIVEGAAGQAGIVPVSPGYFEAVGIRLRRGRLLSGDDVAAGEAAVIPETVARSMFAGREALGSVFKDPQGHAFRVVGVVADFFRPARMDPSGYVLATQYDRVPLVVMVRMRERSEAALKAVRNELALLGPVRSDGVVWWEDGLNQLPRVRDPRFQTLVLGSFGGLGLGLTALGVFGVLAFAVAIRTKEMGVRMALGSGRGKLVGLVVRQAMWPVGIGLAVGVVAAWWASGVAEAKLGVARGAGWEQTLFTAAVTVAVTALIAAYVPARRASRVDPAATLRAE